MGALSPNLPDQQTKPRVAPRTYRTPRQFQLPGMSLQNTSLIQTYNYLIWNKAGASGLGGWIFARVRDRYEVGSVSIFIYRPWIGNRRDEVVFLLAQEWGRMRHCSLVFCLGGLLLCLGWLVCGLIDRVYGSRMLIFSFTLLNPEKRDTGWVLGRLDLDINSSESPGLIRIRRSGQSSLIQDKARNNHISFYLLLSTPLQLVYHRKHEGLRYCCHCHPWVCTSSSSYSRHGKILTCYIVLLPVSRSHTFPKFTL